MEYLSIKQFAEKVGVTPQAIYLRLDKDLKPYLKEQDGRKVLSEDALKHFMDKAACQGSSFTCENNSSPLTLEALIKQLEVKDKQIADLTAALQTAQQLQAATTKQLMLLQAQQDQKPPQEPEQPQNRTFREKWHNFWFG